VLVIAERRARPARAAAAARTVLLLGELGDWPPELAALLAHEGYAGARVARLDVVPPLLAERAVHALLMPARPLGASDLLAVRRIRQASPATAIVVVTKVPTDPDLKRAFEDGATAYLSWPASSDALRHAVESGQGRGVSGESGGLRDGVGGDGRRHT
jgi:DNA-binding NarL/FixJ family response regulator